MSVLLRRAPLPEAKRRLDQLERRILHAQSNTRPPPPPSGAAPRYATCVVAASDASDASKENADYVCDGVADEVEIRAALLDNPGRLWSSGGVLQLTEGTFYLRDPEVGGTLTPTGYGAVWIRGRGAGLTGGTLVRLATGGTRSVLLPFSTINDWRVSDIYFAGLGSAATAIEIDGDSDVLIERCYFSNFPGQAVRLIGTNDRVWVSSCVSESTLVTGGAQHLWVTDNFAAVVNDSDPALWVTGVSFGVVAGNLFQGNDDHGIRLDICFGVSVTGNRIVDTDSPFDAVHLNACSECVVEHNKVRGASAANGIQFVSCTGCFGYHNDLRLGWSINPVLDTTPAGVNYFDMPAAGNVW